MSGFPIARPHALPSVTSTCVVVACLLQVLLASDASGSPSVQRRTRAWNGRAPQLVYRTSHRTHALSPLQSLARALREPTVRPRARHAPRARSNGTHVRRTYALFVYCATSSPLGRRVGLQLGVRRRTDHLVAEPRALLRDVTKVRFAAGIQLEL